MDAVSFFQALLGWDVCQFLYRVLSAWVWEAALVYLWLEWCLGRHEFLHLQLLDFLNLWSGLGIWLIKHRLFVELMMVQLWLGLIRSISRLVDVWRFRMVGALPLMTMISAVSVWLLLETVLRNNSKISNGKLALYLYTFFLYCFNVALNI